jgi:hypothetical protein
MEDGAPGLLTGTVEADEYYHGGVYDKRRKVGKKDKQPVFGALQRSADGAPSKVRAFPLKKTSGKYLTAAVNSTISTEANIFITDEHPAYITLGKQYQHETVNHIQLEYVRKGDPRSIHTNSIEKSWSLFNRGVVGFALVMLNLVIASGIKYAELIASEEPNAFEPLKAPPLSWE